MVEISALALYECLADTSGPGRRNIEYECSRQFLVDGGNFEGSLGYHAFVFNVLCQVQFICSICSIVSPIPQNILAKAFHFLLHTSTSSRLAYGLGDWDDGYVFKPIPAHPRDISFQINFSKKLLGIEKPQNSLPVDGPIIFRESGILIKKINNAELMFRFAPVVHGHSHIDALSINWYVDGHPIILDSGTYQYNHSREIRNYYRSLQAHSTIIPKEKWPIKPLGTFSWRNSLYPELKTSHLNEFEGSYNLKSGHTVNRRLTFTTDGFILYDLCSYPDVFFSQFIVHGFEANDDGLFLLNRSGERSSVVISEHRMYGAENCFVSEKYGQKLNAKKIFFRGDGGQELRIEIKIYRDNVQLHDQ